MDLREKLKAELPEMAFAAWGDTILAVLEPALADLHIVFDGPPAPESGRFVEVENSEGRSINIGEWRERSDGLWELVIKRMDLEPALAAERERCARIGDAAAAKRTASAAYRRAGEAIVAAIRALSPSAGDACPRCEDWRESGLSDRCPHHENPSAGDR